ncbi:MAG: hypothetical protein HKM98_04675 [Gammaproteobacteria bacterium]|nr:hypothetical protein [Gammaproteobacteria bacterium]
MKAKQAYLTVLFVMLFAVSGCVTAPLAVDGSESIGADEGLLAVRFLSDWKGNESMIFEAISFSVHPEGATMSEVLEMRSNDDAQLVALPAGNYSFTRTAIGGNYLLFEDGDVFTIKVGEITYVGDMTINIHSKPFVLAINELRVEDNQEETMASLRAKYGALIEGYPVTAQIISPAFSGDRY